MCMHIFDDFLCENVHSSIEKTAKMCTFPAILWSEWLTTVYGIYGLF